MRIVGVTFAIIVWFYFVVKNAPGEGIFFAASALDRVQYRVPLVLIPIATAGNLPHLLWTLAIVDPVLGRC